MHNDIIHLIFFAKFVQDTGFEFDVHGEKRIFRGTIAYSSGDNLGSQLLGGFKEGSQARRKCKECMGLAEKIQTKVKFKLDIHQSQHLVTNL